MGPVHHLWPGVSSCQNEFNSAGLGIKNVKKIGERDQSVVDGDIDFVEDNDVIFFVGDSLFS